MKVPAKTKEQATLLDVKDLRISFPTSHGPLEVVRGISYTLAKGEVLGFVGESGSGKTQTASALMQLPANLFGASVTGKQMFQAPPMVHPLDLTQLSDKDHRQLRGRQIGYLFQNPTGALNPYIPVGKQIQAACRHHKVAYSLESILQAFDEVGLVDGERLIHQKPHQLSGGENQRVLLALLVMLKTSLLIADEPTSAIDQAVTDQVLSLLKRLHQDHHMAMILITHDFQVAKALCHRIAVFYGGIIVEIGPVDKVMTRPHHPYTLALLRCAQFEMDPFRGTLATIEGSPITPADYSQRCPFFERCGRRSEACHGDMPPLQETGHQHAVRCYHGEAYDTNF